MPTKPTPAPDSPILRGADANQSAPWRFGEVVVQPPAQRVDAALTRLDRAIANTSGAQLAALKDMDQTLAESQKRLRGALSETGLDTDRLAAQSSIAKSASGATLIDLPIIDEAFAEAATRQLMVFIGPIARVVAKRAMHQCESKTEFLRLMAEQIATLPERNRFLIKTGSI